MVVLYYEELKKKKLLQSGLFSFYILLLLSGIYPVKIPVSYRRKHIILLSEPDFEFSSTIFLHFLNYLEI